MIVWIRNSKISMSVIAKLTIAAFIFMVFQLCCPIEYCYGQTENIAITNFQIGTPSFNPYQGIVKFYYSSNTDGKVFAEIQDKDFNLIIDLAFDVPAHKGENTIEWDGKNEKGEFVKTGQYFFSITAIADNMSSFILRRDIMVVLETPKESKLKPYITEIPGMPIKPYPTEVPTKLIIKDAGKLFGMGCIGYPIILAFALPIGWSVGTIALLFGDLKTAKKEFLLPFDPLKKENFGLETVEDYEKYNKNKQEIDKYNQKVEAKISRENEERAKYNQKIKEKSTFINISQEGDIDSNSISASLPEQIKEGMDLINISTDYLKSRGNYDKAIEALEKALKISPNNMYIYSLLARAYARNGQNDMAREIRRKQKYNCLLIEDIEILLETFVGKDKERIANAFIPQRSICFERTESNIEKLKKIGIDESIMEAIEKEWSKNITITSGKADPFINSIGMKFVYIPAGNFLMGSPVNEIGRYSNETQHQVTLTKGFYMQTTEITQGQWKKVMGNNPSKFSDCGDDCPVENVSWDNVQEFIRKLNQMEKTNKYRLPTEAAWEYACRAGSSGRYYGGKDDLDALAWYSDNSEGKTHPVGQKQPNAWGLYDMLGNVWEWCQDGYGNYPAGAVTDPIVGNGDGKVMRGGLWSGGQRSARCANRGWGDSDRQFYDTGFRCAVIIGEAKKQIPLPKVDSTIPSFQTYATEPTDSGGNIKLDYTRVQFPHKEHQEIVLEFTSGDKEQACKICHHTKNKGEDAKACRRCHAGKEVTASGEDRCLQCHPEKKKLGDAAPWKAKKGESLKLKDIFHVLCRGCHAKLEALNIKKPAPVDNCEGCHSPINYPN